MPISRHDNIRKPAKNPPRTERSTPRELDFLGKKGARFLIVRPFTRSAWTRGEGTFTNLYRNYAHVTGRYVTAGIVLAPHLQRQPSNDELAALQAKLHEHLPASAYRQLLLRARIGGVGPRTMGAYSDASLVCRSPGTIRAMLRAEVAAASLALTEVFPDAATNSVPSYEHPSADNENAIPFLRYAAHGRWQSPDAIPLVNMATDAVSLLYVPPGTLHGQLVAVPQPEAP